MFGYLSNTDPSLWKIVAVMVSQGLLLNIAWLCYQYARPALSAFFIVGSVMVSWDLWLHLWQQNKILLLCSVIATVCLWLIHYAMSQEHEPIGSYTKTDGRNYLGFSVVLPVVTIVAWGGLATLIAAGHYFIDTLRSFG